MINPDSLNDNILTPGTKVLIVNAGSNCDSIYTIEEYFENTCGEGCCDGYKLKEIDGVLFWEFQLIEIKE